MEDPEVVAQPNESSSSSASSGFIHQPGLDTYNALLVVATLPRSFTLT